MTNGPLIVQSDHTMMLEVQHPQFSEGRDFLARFAELEKSPEFIHTYRVTPLSLWNAAALDIPVNELLEGLERLARYGLPANVKTDLLEWYSTYGKLVLTKEREGFLQLKVTDEFIFERLKNEDALKEFIFKTDNNINRFLIFEAQRGDLKHALIKIGFPVKDLCGYVQGDDLSIQLRTTDLTGQPFQLRDYQREAVDAFYHSGGENGGNGIVVLPCGSGKTIIGIGTMAAISNHTLIVTTNNVSVHQWRNEILAKTALSEEQVGEFTGVNKVIRPVTITTYQMLTWRKSRQDAFKNLDLFTDQNWGLIVYDEVHLLPAPVFRATVGIQSKRRLGLTATLIREDGKEDDVFALIGPKRYDVPWKVLENRGYIAEAYCTEYRLELPKAEAVTYAHAPKRQQFRIAAENSQKIQLTKELIALHADDQILVIGQFISQVERVAKDLGLPLITGKTKNAEREKLYQGFRTGETKVLVVSKVANFAVDLPDATVMIQLSGTYGSRQEEAQRLGRILRPKKKRSHFYTLVSKNTREQEFGLNRQLFLVEQGYKYRIQYY
ncbi:MAG: DNA repair helicase XPB [Bacteroidota bacterium]